MNRLEDQRDYSIDTLRTIAMLLVILLHVSANYVIEGMEGIKEGGDNFNFWFSNLIDSYTRISVPVFVMIAGGFLIGRNESYQIFYTKRSKRILIPTVFWSIIYAIYIFLKQYFKGELICEDPFWELILNFRPYFHMWYLFMLMGLYFITPIINLSINNLKERSLWLVAVIFVAFGMYLNSYDLYFENTPHFLLLSINYIGYYLLGFLLKKAIRIHLVWLICGYVISGGSIAILSYFTAIHFNNLYFYGFLTPFVIIGSLCVYKIFTQLKLGKNIFSKAANLSFGIYLIHGGVIDFLNSGLTITHITVFDNSILGIPTLFILVLFVSFFITRFLLNNKIMNRLV